MSTVFIALPDALINLGMATLYGAVLGLNRQLHRKPAGLRTHCMVALGTALAALTVARITGATSSDVSRVMQGAITGIGFIGAGVIIHRGEKERVEGLTTAASIWLAAMLGLACGSGEWQIAGAALLFALVILVFGGHFEKAVTILINPPHPTKPPKTPESEHGEGD
ncbi:MgtC/SapB family protein [Silvimonas sp.]|uniref:MgtC/SapB family protein n=1 Tax=Silvimonas sp. TaxID=2650811 RepID=UPI00284A3011|nr:MgtC/SapB family protein [Silvimonas sp.]MDR3426233.1 MgtC/SapB family protein [Silvimonas sp.]